MEHVMIIVNGWGVTYYHKEFHPGCCSISKSTSGSVYYVESKWVLNMFCLRESCSKSETCYM